MTTKQGDGTRGGYRKPTRPAAVSAPQSGQRTDGGPGDKQPIRTPTGGAYGEAQAAEDQQRGAPMAAGGPSAPGPGGPPAGGPGAGPPSGAFGPTQMPNESNMAGASQAGDMLARNPQAALRVLYSKFPHPSIARLIDWSASGGEQTR